MKMVQHSRSSVQKRTGRKKYTFFLVFIFIYQVLRLFFIWEGDLAFQKKNYPLANSLVSVYSILSLAALVVFAFFIRSGVRRLHDFSFNGWWILVPIVFMLQLCVLLSNSLPDSFAELVLLHVLPWIPFAVLALIKPTVGPNRYGPSLAQAESGESADYCPNPEEINRADQLIPATPVASSAREIPVAALEACASAQAMTENKLSPPHHIARTALVVVALGLVLWFIGSVEWEASRPQPRAIFEESASRVTGAAHAPAVTTFSNEDLAKAIAAQDVHKVLDCLKNGISSDTIIDRWDDPNYRRLLDKWNQFAETHKTDFLPASGGESMRGVPVLCVAAAGGNAAIVEALASRSSFIDAKMPNGLTPFHCALLAGNKACMALLADAGADVNEPLPGGINAVDYWCAAGASKNSIHDFLLFLVDKGLDPNLSLSLSVNAEMKRDIMRQFVDSLKQRMEAEAAFNLQQHIDETGMHYLQKFPSELKLSLLHLAAENGWEDLTRALCARGAKITGEGEYAGTPMHTASRKGNKEILDCLLDHGGKLGALSHERWSLLHHAACHGKEEIMRDLLDRGIEIDAQTVYGGTPLHLAVLKKQPRAVRLLVERGANLEIRNRDGMTPLVLALGLGDISCVQLLLDNGADIDGVTADGYPYALVGVTNDATWKYVRDHVFPQPIEPRTPEQRQLLFMLSERVNELEGDLRVRCLFCAAMLGDKAAMRELSRQYDNGVGCPVSRPHALHWQKLSMKSQSARRVAP